MEIVIAKHVQLGRDAAGKFKKESIDRVIRNEAKVTRKYADEYNANYQNAGKYYFIDEEKTKKWNKGDNEKSSKANEMPVDTEKSLRDELKAWLDENGVSYAKNAKLEKLHELKETKLAELGK